ncbi:class I SAM-dependent methyltransferase [Agrococcus sp. SGAir0287]|uniref:class I SAM-dependent methyltransferase n=1 Tax=Agrococcus sp. SGAir0287 TaxID=2070347 RepID=UPI0010CCE25D|nr:class I SAM-dependent methyltransferase [Agrococcus sp. SGAir0287]QCR20031.1 SAM-dependent methyltransferase [Agrococcus sp. SGAir0287]
MDAAALRLLLSRDGLALLDEVSATLDDLGGAVQAVQSLRRRGHDPALVAAVLTQARLRRRGAAKFGPFAASMLFTEAGLEQATRLRVAAVHAGRMRDAGVASVADLGCGIGGDAMAIAATGCTVRAVDADEVTAAVAGFNLAPLPEATVVHGRAEDADLRDVDAIWADPARRDATGRRLPVEAWSPSLPWLLSLADERPMGVKLGPAIDHEHLPADGEAQWVTVDGETVEAVAWTGSLARPGVRTSAIVLDDAGAHELAGSPDEDAVDVRALGAWLHEPAGAVIRARLIGAVAAEIDAGLVSERIAYLTTDADVVSPFTQRFRVVATMPLDERAIQRELRARGIGTLEVKKRGADVDPDRLRRRLRLAGDGAATLLATRVDGRHRAILAERA